MMTGLSAKQHAVVLSVIGLFTILVLSANTAHADILRGTGVFIGAEGNAAVHGATVTGKSDTGFTATTNLAGNTITWNVNASSTTRFGKLGEGLSALAKVAIGDIVSFWGKLSGTGSTLTVDAKIVKDHTQTGTTTPAIGKERGKGKGLGLGARLRHFLDAHDGIKARLEARSRAGSDD